MNTVVSEMAVTLKLVYLVQTCRKREYVQGLQVIRNTSKTEMNKTVKDQPSGTGQYIGHRGAERGWELSSTVRAVDLMKLEKGAGSSV